MIAVYYVKRCIPEFGYDEYEHRIYNYKCDMELRMSNVFLHSARGNFF